MAIRSRFHRSALAVVAGSLVTLSAAAAEPTVASGDTPAHAERAERVHPDCLRETGSRIVTARNQRIQRDARRNGVAATPGQDAQAKCVSAHGRVYSRDDLDRTGAIDLGDALRQLDPAIR